MIRQKPISVRQSLPRIPKRQFTPIHLALPLANKDPMANEDLTPAFRGKALVESLGNFLLEPHGRTESRAIVCSFVVEYVFATRPLSCDAHLVTTPRQSTPSLIKAQPLSHHKHAKPNNQPGTDNKRDY